MKLVPVDRTEIGISRRGFRRSKNLDILTTFVESDMDTARLDAFDYTNARAGSSSLKASIKRFGFNGINAVSRKGNLYLIKEHDE